MTDTLKPWVKLPEVTYDLVCLACEKATSVRLDLPSALAFRRVLRLSDPDPWATGVDPTCEFCGLGRLVLE